MPEDTRTTITRMITAPDGVDERTAETLLPILYDELRRLARALMAGLPPGNTLQPTAVVHEAYVRLVEGDPSWNGRGHFFGAAAMAMRQILVDQARRKGARKRGGGRKRVELDDAEFAIAPPAVDMLSLNEALGKLEREDPRAARVVMLRFFAGLTVPEIAAALEVSVSTVEREWRFARSLLFALLSDPLPEETSR